MGTGRKGFIVNTADSSTVDKNTVQSWMYKFTIKSMMGAVVKIEHWLRQQILPESLQDCSPDKDHPHKRRFTAAYRRKKGIVKNVWIVSGTVMVLQASPAIIIAITLGTTFLSFMILDETS